MFYRLIKPIWGKKKIQKDGESIENPDFVRLIKGPDTLEGCFDSDFVREKNEEIKGVRDKKEGEIMTI